MWINRQMTMAKTRTGGPLAAAFVSLARAAAIFAAAGVNGACAPLIQQAGSSEILVSIEPGEEWLHRYSALQKNPPQFAVWAERLDNSFGGTIFATRKAATNGWAFSGGNTRKEALPVWTAKKAGEAVDAIAGATPRGPFAVAVAPKDGSAERQFYLYVELNHSTDFNAAYPEDAKEGEPGYSGGSGGSGQPSIVYRCLVDLDGGPGGYTLTPIGHGSADGSDGLVDPDLSTLTSALRIVRSVTAELKP